MMCKGCGRMVSVEFEKLVKDELGNYYHLECYDGGVDEDTAPEAPEAEEE